MFILDRFMEIAMKEINVKEIDGPANNSRIIEYAATTTLAAKDDSVPWCSAFVNWVVDQCGVKGTRSAAARSWLKWGVEIKIPIRGCIVVLSRGLSPTSGHVGFYVGSNKLFVNILGGNQKDSVNISEYSKFKVLGYRVPTELLKD